MMLVVFRKLFDGKEIIRIRRNKILPESGGLFPAMRLFVYEGERPSRGCCHVRVMRQDQCFEHPPGFFMVAAFVDQYSQLEEIAVMAMPHLFTIFYEVGQVLEERCQ